jgi:hypothetical protein
MAACGRTRTTLMAMVVSMGLLVVPATPAASQEVMCIWCSAQWLDDPQYPEPWVIHSGGCCGEGGEIGDGDGPLGVGAEWECVQWMSDECHQQWWYNPTNVCAEANRCGGGGAHLAISTDLKHAVSAHDVATITRLVHGEQSGVTWNVQRSALQVRDCQGQVVFSMDVEDAYLASRVNASLAALRTAMING